MNFLKGIWSRLSTPSRTALGVVLVSTFLGTVVIALIFHFGFMTATNKMEICISCHEMDGVYEEYQQTTHYNNASGVQATCADCHVPHGKTIGDYFDKYVAKVVIGTKDIYNHLIGTYPDRKAFDAARYHLAQNVITEMRHRGSKECLHCHKFEHMKFDEQDRSAAKKHKKAMEKGDKTCIDCHVGVAHEEQDPPDEDDDDEEE